MQTYRHFLVTLVVSLTGLQIYYMVVGSPDVVYYVWLFALSDSDIKSVVSSREAEERMRLSSPLGCIVSLTGLVRKVLCMVFNSIWFRSYLQHLYILLF